MARFVAFSLVLFAGSCFGKSARIIGGSDTNIQEFPSLVQVDFQNPWSNAWSQNCAGTILNELYFLSAAHCFEGSNYQPSRRRIRAGTTYRNYGGVLAYVAQDTKYPLYRVASRWDADITVVRLVSQLSFNPVIQQGYFLGQGTLVPDNLPLLIAGWGRTSVGPFSSVLQSTNVYSINNSACRQLYNQLPTSAIVTHNMICAGVPDGGRDHCEGDAGGGLYYGQTVVGIISWGHGCGREDFPGVSTSVSSYSNWIQYVASN